MQRADRHSSSCWIGRVRQMHSQLNEDCLGGCRERADLCLGDQQGASALRCVVGGKRSAECPVRVGVEDDCYWVRERHEYRTSVVRKAS